MVKKNKIIAIIPARGGSKRIPKKNIIDFFGKPLIARTIEAAINSKIFDKVLVSTDNEEIANIAKKFGAEVPFLRTLHHDDHSPISQVIIHSIDQVEKILSEEYDTVIQLMPNCPLRNTEDIINSYKNFIKQKATFQISCLKFGWMNPWWAFKLKENFHPEPLFPKAIKSRSQDLEELYCPTGAIWIADIKELKKQKNFYGKPLTFFPIDWKSAVDIDNYEDLEMAKAIFLLKKSNNKFFNNINNTAKVISP